MKERRELEGRINLKSMYCMMSYWKFQENTLYGTWLQKFAIWGKQQVRTKGRPNYQMSCAKSQMNGVDISPARGLIETQL